MNAIQKLRQMVGEVTTEKNPARLQDDWGLIQRLLGRLGADSTEVGRVCTARDISALDAIVTRLEHPDAPPTVEAQPQPGPAADAGTAAVSSDDMKAAMRAFRKRLKLARLADESKLGGRRLTPGRHSQIDAIQPPTEFPKAVWDALVRDGKLTDTGQGFYALKE